MHFIDSLYQKLMQLEATSSSNEKSAIVRQLTKDERKVLVFALEPTLNFYIHKLPRVTHWESGEPTGEWNDGIYTMLGDLTNRTLSGEAARVEVAEALSSLKPTHAEVLRRVLLKDLKCGVGVTMFNAAFPWSLTDVPYMRCSLPAKSNLGKWGPEVWARGVISQEKADGMFAALNLQHDVVMFSRQGSKFPPDAVAALTNAWPKGAGVQVHGELLVKGPEGNLLERQIGNGLLNSLLQSGDLPPNHSLEYHVWDAVPLECAVPKGKCPTPYQRRLGTLRELAEGLPAVKIIPTRVVHSLPEALAHYRELLEQGKEGTVVKSPDGPWQDTTSKDCVKMKLQVDVDLRVVKLNPGNGKNEATFGAATCETSCGQLRVDVSGFTDKKRQEIFDRRDRLEGEIWTVRANEILLPSASNDLHSLFLPRFVEDRRDKAQADSLQDVKDQFEAAIK